MRVIVDANAVGTMLGADPAPAWAGALRWLLEGSGAIAIGGKLTDELAANDTMRGLLVTLERAGKVVRTPDAACRARAVNIEQAGIAKSDDPHILAVAQLSGARTLASNDKALHQDFKNKALIDAPRGKVCSSRAKNSSRLLVHTAGCGRK